MRNYKVLKLIGKGGFSKVLLGMHECLFDIVGYSAAEIHWEAVCDEDYKQRHDKAEGQSQTNHD